RQGAPLRRSIAGVLRSRIDERRGCDPAHAPYGRRPGPPVSCRSRIRASPKVESRPTAVRYCAIAAAVSPFCNITSPRAAGIWADVGLNSAFKFKRPIALSSRPARASERATSVHDLPEVVAAAPVIALPQVAVAARDRLEPAVGQGKG